MKSLVGKMKMELWTQDKVSISKSHLKLVRPNNPSNCLTLDLSELNDVPVMEIKKVKFYFSKESEVTVLIEDKNSVLKRSQMFNKFQNSGSKISLTNLTGAKFKYYAVEFYQNVFVENDPSVNCLDYPSKGYESLDHCDSVFTLNTLSKHFPENFIPIWSVDDPKNVTDWMLLDEKFEAGMPTYRDFVGGTVVSDCPVPCTVTKIKTVLIDEKYALKSKRSKVEIVFSRNVEVARTDFKKFSMARFLSALGGSMGLWLGLGVLQTFELIVRMAACRSK